MQEVKASDFHPEVLNLFDKYVHGLIDRRGFLDGAAKFTGTLGAAATLDLLRPNYSEAAQMVKPDDPRIKAEFIDYQSPMGYGRVHALWAEPAKRTAKLPGVLVIHENRGLNPHIQDIVRRFAVANFVALGPDELTSLGGYPGTDEAGAAMQQKLEMPKMLEDFIAGARTLKAHPACNGKIGAVGFCFGGGIVNSLAVRLGPDLAAAAPFYGGQPRAEDVPKIKAQMLINYAEMDDRINAGWPAYETALKANNVKYEMFKYPGTMHGFNNDTTPRYDKAASDLAMERTIALFNKVLRST